MPRNPEQIIPSPSASQEDAMSLDEKMPQDGHSSREAVESLHNHEMASGDLEKATIQAPQSNHDAAAQVPVVDDWDGPDDPENPMNWSPLKKGYHMYSVAFLAFAVTAASSLISPANASIVEDFHVSQVAAILPVSLYVIGLGLGPMLGAPLSEIIGRTNIFKVTPPIFMLLSLGAGFSKTFGGLLVCRLLSGIIGAPVIAVGGGTNADLYAPHERALPTSLYIMSPFFGPALGPVIGGFAAQYKGWRWTIWCSIFIAIIAWVICLPMQETFKKVILKRRAKKLGLPGPPSAPVHGLGYVKLILTMTVAKPLRLLLTEPIVLLLSLYTSFNFGVLYLFFAAYPYTFEGVYHFNTWQSGLTFLGIGIGVVLGVITVLLCDRLLWLKEHKKAQGQKVAPEHRLYAAMMGSLGLPIGLFWFAWTARPEVHWISPILAGIPFAWGNITLFISSVMYFVDVYGPMRGASALAANGLLRYVIGGCFPLFTLQMYRGMGIAWASSLLGFVCILLLPIPFVFFRFGPWIRSKSSA